MLVVLLPRAPGPPVTLIYRRCSECRIAQNIVRTLQKALTTPALVSTINAIYRPPVATLFIGYLSTL
jgi:hypothetical protein